MKITNSERKLLGRVGQVRGKIEMLAARGHSQQEIIQELGANPSYVQKIVSGLKGGTMRDAHPTFAHHDQHVALIMAATDGLGFAVLSERQGRSGAPVACMPLTYPASAQKAA